MKLRIKEYREALKLTKKELADKAYIAGTLVSGLEIEKVTAITTKYIIKSC